MPKTATPSGVVNRRAEQMAAVVKSREDQVDKEMKEGGQTEGISVLARPDREGAGGAVSVVKPEGVDQAEWDKLDDEAKAGLAEAEAERVRVEEEAARAAAGGETDEQKKERERKETEAAALAEAERKKADEAARAAAAGGKTKIKVDGQEVEVDEAQIRDAGIRALQKETAADKRLEEASRLFREATAAVEAARSGAVQDLNKDKGGASLPGTGGGAAEVLTDAAFTEAVKKIQYGSEAEAAAVLKDLITKAARAGQPETLTLDRVAEMLDFRDATRWAHEEYKDILGDPNLKALFSANEKKARAAGDMRPYRELYTEIGNGLRDWLKTKGPATPPPAPAGTSRTDLKERKASVVVVTSAAGRQAAPPQPKEPSSTETIDKMREQRDRQAGRIR